MAAPEADPSQDKHAGNPIVKWITSGLPHLWAALALASGVFLSSPQLVATVALLCCVLVWAWVIKRRHKPLNLGGLWGAVTGFLRAARHWLKRSRDPIAVVLSLLPLPVAAAAVFTLRHPDRAVVKYLNFNYKASLEPGTKIKAAMRKKVAEDLGEKLPMAAVIRAHQRQDLSSMPKELDQQYSLVVGGAGAGKTPMSDQLALELMDDPTIDYVFHIDLSKLSLELIRPQFDIPTVLAKSQPTASIISDPEFYRALFRSAKSVVVLDSLDEAFGNDSKADARIEPDPILSGSRDLARSGRTKVIIFSRPEAYLCSASYQNDLPWPIFEIAPINTDSKEELRAFLLRHSRFEAKSKGDRLGREDETIDLIGKSPVLHAMATQLDYLHKIHTNVVQLEGLSEYERMEFLVGLELTRATNIHLRRLSEDPKAVMAASEFAAFDLLRNGGSDFPLATGDPRYLSGLIGLSDAAQNRFQFSPAPIAHYLVVKYAKTRPEAWRIVSHAKEFEATRRMFPRLFRR